MSLSTHAGYILKSSIFILSFFFMHVGYVYIRMYKKKCTISTYVSKHDLLYTLKQSSHTSCSCMKDINEKSYTYTPQKKNICIRKYTPTLYTLFYNNSQYLIKANNTIVLNTLNDKVEKTIQSQIYPGELTEHELKYIHNLYKRCLISLENPVIHINKNNSITIKNSKTLPVIINFHQEVYPAFFKGLHKAHQAYTKSSPFKRKEKQLHKKRNKKKRLKEPNEICIFDGRFFDINRSFIIKKQM